MTVQLPQSSDKLNVVGPHSKMHRVYAINNDSPDQSALVNSDGSIKMQYGAYVGSGSKDGSAAFQVDSTSQGLLVPRMTTTQRDAIVLPTDGLTLYNTTTDKFTVRQDGAWVEMGSGSGGASAFTDLTDVPSSYSGQALKLVRVNAGATGLEFADPSIYGHTIQEEGVSLTQRALLNFVGSAINAADDSGSGATKITMQHYLNEIASLSSASTPGFLYLQQTGDLIVARQINGSTAISVSSPELGNITIDATGILGRISTLSGFGFIVDTGSGTAAFRQLVAGTGINITNPTGSAGNPTISSTGLASLSVSAPITTTGGSTPTVGLDLSYNYNFTGQVVSSGSGTIVTGQSFFLFAPDDASTTFFDIQNDNNVGTPSRMRFFSDNYTNFTSFRASVGMASDVGFIWPTGITVANNGEPSFWVDDGTGALAEIDLLGRSNTWTAENTFNGKGIFFNLNREFKIQPNGVVPIDIRPGLGGGATEIHFYDDLDSNFTGLKAPSLGAADVIFSLMTVDGATGDMIITDGAGNLSFATPASGGSPGGSNTQLQYNNSGSFAGASGIVTNGAAALGINKVATAAIGIDIFVSSPLSQGVRIEGASSTDLGFSSYVTGDAFVRFSFKAGGLLAWGSGSGASDTSLYRNGVGILKTDGTIQIGGKATFSGATSGTTDLLATAIAGTTVLTLPAATDTLVGKATTDIFTNKTITASTNVIGGVTMTLGSDASYDIYYRNSSGILTRLANGTTGQVLTATTSNAPSWASGGGGSGTVNSGTQYQLTFYANNGTAVDGNSGITTDASNVLSIAATARTTGNPKYYHRVITPADTGLTASTESIGEQFGGNTSAATVSRQFATGALTTQRENVFVAPTYAFVGASTLTNAATVAITGAPITGTNATITNPISLWVQGGASWFDGATRLYDTATIVSAADVTKVVSFTLAGTTTGTNSQFVFSNTVGRTYTMPNLSGTIGVINANQTWGANQQTYQQAGGGTGTIVIAAYSQSQAANSVTTQQYSPRIQINARGWTGAASQNAIYEFGVRTNTGTNPVTANYIISTNINAAGLVDRFFFDDMGRLGIGQTPTAYLHLPAGAATAVFAPLKFTSGTNLTTAEAGAMEYNGTNLFFTRSGTTRENVLIAVDNASAPSTNIGVSIVNYYGSSATNFLGTPDRWISVNILGTVYKIPMYS